MSVYLARKKDPKTGKTILKSPYYQFDFVLQIDGERRRFHGSTGETARGRAQEFERQEKRRLRTEKPNDRMTLGEACLRYFDEVVQGQRSEVDSLIAFAHCGRLIGDQKRLMSITPNDIALAVRKRAGETKGKRNHKPVAPATVNRQIIEPMRQILRRARKVWHVSIDLEQFDWRQLALKEPKERVREFVSDEADRFWAALRPDYVPFLLFLAARGLRVNAAIGMTKEDLDEPRCRIRIWRKGDGLVWIPVTRGQMATIVAEAARAPGKAVWSYEMQRHPNRGKRRPISYESLKRTMATALKAARITDFRIHDLRHEFASKLLRATRDLALVQKSLMHSDIASTVRYAHVLDEDVRDGLEALESRNSPGMGHNSQKAGQK
ncbi:MAG: site-specific integrase [Roseibium sp.]|nr:site-specific integrase [Roseibium sp.]